MDNVSFKVMRGLDAVIQNKPRDNGCLYFATDTGKIYLDTLEKDKILMGKSSGVYYGQRELSQEETETDATKIVFSIDRDIEGSQKPNINDLILNKPDGGFYQVVEPITETTVTGERIAVSGSGSGGGPGTGSSRPVIDIDYSIRYFRYSDPESMKIAYKCMSALNDGSNQIKQIEYQYGKQVEIIQVSHAFGEEIVFDLGAPERLKYLSTLNRNQIKIIVSDAYGNRSFPAEIYVEIIDLALENKGASLAKVNKGAIYTHTCYPKGGSKNSLNNRRIEYSLSTQEGQIVDSGEKTVRDANEDLKIDIDTVDVAHGHYKLTLVYCGELVNRPSETIYSNSIEIQLGIFDSQQINATPIVLSSFINGNIVSQYTPLIMQYMIIDNLPEETIIYPIVLVNNKEDGLEAKINKISEWEHVFTVPGEYELIIKYNNTSFSQGKINVTTYSEDQDFPTIDASETEIYFTALGKSNSQTNKDSWESIGKQKVQAQFTDFLWGNENGWIKDSKEKDSMGLKLTNGAKLSFPTYYPFQTDAMLTGFTIELDFKLSAVTNFTEPLVQCLSKYTVTEDNKQIEKIATGFHLTGQKATLNSQNYTATNNVISGEVDEEGNVNENDIALSGLTSYYGENERIHLTYVIEARKEGSEYYFVHTYLNGVLSGLMRLQYNDKFQDAQRMVNGINLAASTIEFDSTYGDIYLYNLRTYRTALSARQVINNYIADISDMETKINLYNDNNIIEDGKISYSAISNLSYNLNIPYIIFNGGNGMGKKFDNDFSFKNTYALPTAKNDYRLMSMSMFYPDGTTYSVPFEAVQIVNNAVSDIKVTKFEDFENNAVYRVNRGVQVYGQGTSSMVYPIKNLRLKFAQENDYPQVYKNAAHTEIVCLKADYMESSSSHNTGTGNLVYDLYTNMGLKTPPQIFQTKHNQPNYDITTAIKGFPVICFYGEGDSTNYTYIGRYNFNLDKATPEPFGFKPQIVYTGENDVIDADGNSRKVVETCGYETEIINGKTVLPIDDNKEEVKRDIVQCWEILSNDAGTPTKFLNPTLASGYEGNPENYKDFLSFNNKWRTYYEDRYPDKMVKAVKYHYEGDTKEKPYPGGVEALEKDLDNGLYRMSAWINSTSLREVPANPPELIEPKFLQTLDVEWNKDKQYYDINHNPMHFISVDKIYAVEIGLKENNQLTYSIDNDIVIQKLKEYGYNTYTFTYSNVSDNPEVTEYKWVFSASKAVVDNLNEYGISYTGVPQAGNSLSVRYYWEPCQYNGNADNPEYILDNSNNLIVWKASSSYEKFTKDTQDYRKSKFKTEFVEYFDMEFSLFYYIITLTLLMMDSRAKNMMLASWDQKIWYPILYDMDTMLGLNNTGFNKFSFDVEDEEVDKIFNAYDSVLWNNFKLVFEKEITDFYSRMRNNLTLNKLLENYGIKAADSWNEALVSLDAIYKYRNPFEQGYQYQNPESGEVETMGRGQKNYLYAAQGRRSNHRNWWLTNRLNYLDSKYIPTSYGVDKKPDANNSISFRAYALPTQKATPKAEECIKAVPPNHKFKLTALNNSYQSIFMGVSAYGPIKTSAGETVELGPETARHEVESWILNPQLISDLGDLSDKYVGLLEFPNNMRITELKLGQSQFTNTHQNTYSSYFNNLLTSLNLSKESFPYLKLLNVARCTGLRELDLTQCSKLETLYADGLKLNSISFPSNSTLKELYLPSSLVELELNNQIYLNTVEFDSQSVLLNKIILRNVPQYNSYPLVRSFIDANIGVDKQYEFTDIYWKITDRNDLNFDENNMLQSIGVLEDIKDEKIHAINKAVKISGTLEIDVTCKCDEYQIYKIYKTLYPDLKIIYSNKVELDKGIVIQIMQNDLPNSDIVLEVMLDNQTTLSAGIALINKDLSNITAQKPTDEVYEYEWNASYNNDFYVYSSTDWKIENTNVEFENNSEDMKNYRFSEDFKGQIIKIIPLFSYRYRKYEVQFKENWGSQQIIKTETVIYGQELQLPHYYYKPHPDEPNNRYEFRYWADINDKKVTPTALPETIVVTSYLTLVPYFTILTKNQASNNNYFEFNQNSVKLNSKYQNLIQEPLIIPLKHNNVNITLLEARGFSYEITKDTRAGSYIGKYIGFTNIDDNMQLTIGESCFEGARNLKTIELPTCTYAIERKAFENCTQLTNVGWLGDSLVTSIGNRAFYYAPIELNLANMNNLTKVGVSAFKALNNNSNIVSQNNNSYVTPAGLREIDTDAFANLSNLIFEDFSNVVKIGKEAFKNSGKNLLANKKLNIILNNDISSYEDNCFSGYAIGGNIENVIYNGDGDYSRLGLDVISIHQINL